MTEADLERWFYQRCQGKGWGCLKLGHRGKFGHSGDPDRLVIVPPGRHYYVELKTETGILSELQQKRHAFLRRLGCHVVTLHGKQDVQLWFQMMECIAGAYTV